MKRCIICGYKISKHEIFCNHHKKIINDIYKPEHHLIAQYIILDLIKKQHSDIYYIKKDKMLPPVEYVEIVGREKFLEYSKKVTKENLDSKIKYELKHILGYSSIEIRSPHIYITMNNGVFDYEDFDKLNECGFIFQYIKYTTKLFSRDVKCVISVIFEPEIPKRNGIKMSQNPSQNNESDITVLRVIDGYSSKCLYCDKTICAHIADFGINETF